MISSVLLMDGDGISIMLRSGVARQPGCCTIACIVLFGVLQPCGGGICWMAWTERPKPRVSATSVRSFMTKRPRTSVWSGRPFTVMPVERRDLGARLQLGVVDGPGRGRGRPPRCRPRRRAGSRPCADRGRRSWPGWRRSSARSRRSMKRPAFISVSISGICVSTPGKAAIDGPDVVAGLLLGRMRRMVGGDHVDGAVGERLPTAAPGCAPRAPAG